ncbi:MAG: hypothetical protein AAF387_08045 [Pseudomonadota bacterium]
MTDKYQEINQDIQSKQALYGALFSTVAMAGYLWNQIITGLVPPVV